MFVASHVVKWSLSVTYSKVMLVRWPVVSVVCVLEGLRRLRLARKPTAFYSPSAGTKAGDIGREWAGGRPERVFALPCSCDVLLAAVDPQVMWWWRCDAGRHLQLSHAEMQLPI